jgi:dihydropyrimidinase
MVCFEDRIAECDLIIQNSKIADIGEAIQTEHFDEIVYADGLYVLPGMIDFHVHLDDKIGKYYLADNYRSGTRCAVENGITTICSFVTQGKNQSLAEAVKIAMNKAKKNCYTDYLWHLTPIRFDEKGWGEIFLWVDKGFKTFKFYTTYKDEGIYTGYEQLEETIKRLAPLGVKILVHCEDENVLTESAGKYSTNSSTAYSHTMLRPESAEINAIHKVMEISKKHRAEVHIVHISTAEGARIVHSYQQELSVSCETAPHYIFLNDSFLKRGDGTRWLCTPPLRSESTSDELRRLAKEGLIDIFATDHCPFLKKDKDHWLKSVREVPNGLPGIGSLVRNVYKLFNNSSEESLLFLVKSLSTNPAKRAGIYPRKGTIQIGSDADLVLMNPDSSERPIRSTYADVYEPFESVTSKLSFEYVFLRGNVVVKNNRLVDEKKCRGECLCIN